MLLSVKMLQAACDVLAPDGSEVRILAQSSRGSMAHFTLHPGQVSVAVAHRSIEEIWFVTSGAGEMWCDYQGREQIVELKPGVSLTIPTGASFQFRCLGDMPLCAIGVSMPPWPGMDEASQVPGKW